MGRFLIIGLTTGMSFKKEEAEDQFDSVESAKEFIQENYAPSDVFDMYEDDQQVYYHLNSKLLEKELQPFLTDFFNERFERELNKNEEMKNRIGEIIREIGECKTAQSIYELAKAVKYENFQYDTYWDSYFIKKKFWNNMELRTIGITLSMDGKIIMEFYGTLFDYFKKLIAEKFSMYRLAKAIRVTITG